MPDEKNDNLRESISPAVLPGGAGEVRAGGFVFDIKRYAIHDGPGIRTTVFFKGCPLQCQWCHNPESWQMGPEPALRSGRCVKCGHCVELCSENAVSINGELPKTDPEKCTRCGTCIEPCPGGAREIIGSRMSVGEVMSEIEKDVIFYDQSDGGATFSGGEPLAQSEFLLGLLRECRSKGIHTAVDTCCYAQSGVIDAVGEIADLFLCDVKHIDREIHKQFTGVDNTLILDNIKRLCRAGRQVIIRIPIIPGFNDDLENIAAIGEFAVSASGITQIDILPYNRGGSEKSTRLAAGVDIIRIETPSDRKMNQIAERLGGYGFKVKIGG